MRYRIITIVILLFIGLNLLGQQKKIVPMMEQPQKTEVQAFEEIVLHLQAENQAIQKRLENMEKEVELYRGDVRTEIADMKTDMGLWFAFLTIAMAILGVAIPIIINNKHENYVFKLLEDAKYEAREATEQAKQAKQAVADIEELKIHVATIEEKISKNAIAAEQSAIEAKASQLFFQAFSEKDPFKAIELYTEAIELMPDMTEAYINRGKLRHDIGDYAKAMIDYEEALKLNPNDAMVYFNSGNLRDTMGDKNGAVKDFDRAIALDPYYAGAYLNRGNVKRDLGDIAGALKDFDKAIEINQSDAAAYNNRAIVLMELGDFDKALDAVNDALVYERDDFAIWETKGEICMKMDNYKGAEFAFTKAIVLNPKNKESIKYRAACYRKMAELETDSEKKTDYLSKALDDELRLKQLIGHL